MDPRSRGSSRSGGSDESDEAGRGDAPQAPTSPSRLAALNPARWRGTPRVVAWSVVAGLALTTVAVSLAGPWDGGQRTAERRTAEQPQDRQARHHGRDTRTLAGTPLVLNPVDVGQAVGRGAAEAPLPTSNGLSRTLRPLLDSPALGTRHSAAVVDAATGELVYGVRADAAAVPASTIKVATCVAALRALGPEHRIATVVTSGAKRGEIVLVGGGDPTLTALRPDRRARAAGGEQPASLVELARSTAKALRDSGTTTVRLRYDTSAYTGPLHHPIGPGNENIAPVTALMVDEGRQDPRSTRHAPRVADPAGDAAASFAALLRAEGVTVRGKPAPGRAPRSSEARIAEVRSLPLGELVERALTDSDNDIAEAIARQTALARNEPASFAGAGRAVAAVLADAGVDLHGARFRDGSGLDRRDTVSARLLADLLALAASPDAPQLRPALTGLPVAGFTGTLSSRYGGEVREGGQELDDGRGPRPGSPERAPGGSAAGLVRAKTGTLTGVNTLAGTAVDADGRLLTFAFTASGTDDPERATEALDRLAAAVAGCGCR